MTIGAVEFDYIRKLVRERSAIVLEPGKEYLAESRLLPVARDEGCATLQDLVAKIRADRSGGLERKVIEAMTTNETTFFRDVHPFEALRKTVLPDVLAARAAQRQLNIWCGASSSGQEPYSIAMVLRERAADLAGWSVRLLASDISREMLDRTKEGRYSQLEVNRGLPATMLVKWFEKQGTSWQVKPELRAMLELHEMNLAGAWPAFPSLDIVFMRNVLIYFDVETKQAILGKVRRLLRPDGWLLLGGAETTLNLDDAFERVPVEKATCYRLRDRNGRTS
ncbi:MAG TPA: protein-glutamate O-methyltransferase CheR [Candidatus Binatia bacterium]|jgi:chemotaxis protein methyltransferase CheR|nr:protein-glutamate O-methyltransferase CheR [Candidatus Binatia bacterium]